MPVHLHSAAPWHSDDIISPWLLSNTEKFKGTNTLSLSFPLSQKVSFGLQIPWFGAGRLLESLFTLQGRKCQGPLIREHHFFPLVK